MYDCLYPSRVVVEVNKNKEDYAREFINLTKKCIKNKKTEFILTGYDEAEFIKLFSNTYLAMRVAFLMK